MKSETTNQNQLVSLKQAAEELGTEDVTQFRKTVKRLKCLIRVGHIEVVDMDQLETRLREEAVHQQETKVKRAKSQQSEAHKLGLCQARLTRAPELIAKKERKIKETEEALNASETPYEKHKAQQKLDELTKATHYLEHLLELLLDQLVTDRVLAHDQVEIMKKRAKIRGKK